MVPIESSGSASGSTLSTKNQLIQIIASNIPVYAPNTDPEIYSVLSMRHISDLMLDVVNYTSQSSTINHPDER